MIRLTEARIKEQFGIDVFDRGFHYQLNDRVNALNIIKNRDQYRIKAKVVGSRKLPYEVTINLPDSEKPSYIVGSCTCPMLLNCKHVVAVLLSSVGQSVSEAVNPISSILSTVPSSRMLFNTSEFDRWASTLELNQNKNAPHTARARLSDYHLLYILKKKENKNCLSVSLLVARKLKKGGFGNGYKHFSDSLETHLRALLPIDHDILHRLEIAERMQQSYFQGLFQNEYELPEGGASEAIFCDMINTGRCYWEQHQGSQSLHLGEAKKAALSWQLENNGYQKLICQVDGKNVQPFPMTPLYYHSPQTSTCGQLIIEGAEDQALIKAILFVPIVQPQDIPKLEKIMRERFHRVEKIPLPHRFKSKKLEDIQPKPKLVLFGYVSEHHYFYQKYRHACELPLGRVSFLYAGSEVSISGPLITHAVDEQSLSLNEITRNIAAEGDLINSLLNLGVDILAKKFPTVSFYNLEPLDLLVAELDNEVAQREFLSEKVNLLRKAGWEVIIQDTFPVENIVEADEWYSEVFETNDNNWFNMEIGLFLDDQKINILPLLVRLIEQYPEQFTEKYLNSLTAEACTITLQNGQKVSVPVTRVKGILATLTELYDTKSLNEAGLLSVSRLRAMQLKELENAMNTTQLRWLGDKKLKELSDRLIDFKGIETVLIPKHFQGELRDYQKTGVNWLNFLKKYRLGGILCDDMGLGKTIQTLAHLLVEKEAKRLTKPCLIVAPTSLMENWRSEAEQFAPNLKVLVLQGQDRQVLFNHIQKVDIVLTTYPLVVRDKDILLGYEYEMVILDEAQFVKNANTKAYLILQQIQTQHRLCLTGTPMENHLGELWSLFNFLSPGLLGNSKQFSQIFRTPIEKQGNTLRRQYLNQRLKPYLLRRTKENVVLELPSKTEVIHKIVMEEAQRDLYESIRISMETKVKQAITAKGFASSQIIILDALLKLRQVCCDPRLLKLEQAKKVEQSAKLEFLMEMLGELLAENRKILIFSSFTSMLALIEAELIKQNMTYVKLTGSTIDRKTPIQQFQKGDASIFLISLKAGGTGLNLTAADTVIHYDPWWNPAAEAQATDRAHRIGQVKPVFVYKLVTTGTVEEKILKMQDKKRALLQSVFDGSGGAQSGKISPEDLNTLFQPIESAINHE